MDKRINKNQGFTLIELLVVIAIIGILAGIVLTSLGTARNKAKDAAVKSGLANLKAQMELSVDANGTYGGEDHGTVSASGWSGAGMGSGDGFGCDNPGSVKILENVFSNSGKEPFCGVDIDGQSWIAYTSLSTSGIDYCVDSSGNSGEITPPPANFDTSNPPVKCK